MPDPSHRPYSPHMTIIRPNSKPAFWWLFPWAYARTLHTTANALKAYADQADRCVEMQIRIIEDKDHEIAQLKRRVEDLNDAVIKGIIPDARPYHAASERLQDNPQFRDDTIHE